MEVKSIDVFNNIINYPINFKIVLTNKKNINDYFFKESMINKILKLDQIICLNYTFIF